MFAEFGVGDNEIIIPAGTPVIIKGVEGTNKLVVAKSDDVIPKVKNNLLKPSNGDVTAVEDQHLLVFQKTSSWTEDDPYNNYAFFRLKTGRVIPAKKAYLNGVDVSEELSQVTNAAKGVWLLEDLLALSSEEQVATSFTPIGSACAPPLTNETYDLCGRHMRAGHLMKGVYIVNGRKVVIK